MMTSQTGGRPVVVGVDGSSGADLAVRWAARHAAEIGAPLRLVHAVAAAETVTALLPIPVGVSSVGPRRPCPTASQVLESATAEAARHLPQPRVTAEPASADPERALLDASAEAALLVLGSGGHHRVTSTLFGSVALRVIADAGCPTVVVRGESPPDAPVVVAVDNSESCEPALRFAFREAARRRRTLVAVHAWQPPLPRTGAGMMTVAPAWENLAESAGIALATALAPLRAAFPDVTVRERLLGGHPEVAVPDDTTGAALIVAGSRGRGPVAGLILGSTSQALIHRSSCPVAVVRDS